MQTNEFRELGRLYGATKFQGDNYPGQTFEFIYEDIFRPFKNVDPLTILEIGVQKGGSLKVWRDYFPYANIIGIDIDQKAMYKDNRITTYLVNQADVKNMQVLINHYGGFDIVIDDGGHHSTEQIITLNLLLPHTRLLYCVEDLDTSYRHLYPGYQDPGKDTIVEALNKYIDPIVIGDQPLVDRIDFRKRFCALYIKRD
jgi:hypothetical protein